MKIPLFLLFLFAFSFAQAGNDTTEGGNITEVNATLDQVSSWYGVCGQALPSAFAPVTINATPGNTTCLTINTGESSCTNGLVGTIHLLFSNGSSAITSLSPGSLPLLDIFINRESENGTATFTSLSSFSIPGFGTVAGVPTTYTYSPVPGTFKMGYMQDQAGNIVIATPLVSDQTGFNGSAFDFQLMLPTKNVTPTLYYLTAAKECAPSPSGGNPPQGGGGTHTPYYNVTQPPPPPPPPPPGQCVPPSCCTSDAQCGDKQMCSIPPGSSSGECEDIAACGIVTNHSIVQVWECGGLNCPACPVGYACQNYTCILYGLKGPESLFLGANAMIEAKENGGPCKFCDIEITDPSGKKFLGKTDENGKLTIPLKMLGIYKVALMKGGLPIKSINIVSFPQQKPEEEKPTVTIPEPPCLLALLLVLLILVTYYIIRRRKEKVQK
jgi:hypothetical protein